MGQAPQPRGDVGVGIGGQTGSARGGFRVTVRVTVRVRFQRYRPCYLTTVVCSENRPKAGKNGFTTVNHLTHNCIWVDLANSTPVTPSVIASTFLGNINTFIKCYVERNQYHPKVLHDLQPAFLRLNCFVSCFQHAPLYIYLIPL